MDKSNRTEIKVGVFVAAGMILLAVLLLQFSKSTSAFRGTYELRLHAANVGGIKPRAQVLLAGVQVGTVADIQLAPDTKSVTLFLNIYKDYVIYHDARFVIEQEGFLGDKYVSIIPTANSEPKLDNRADVPCEEPFNLQEVARSASGFIQRLDETAKKLDAAVTDIRRTVLNDQTLTNFALAINNVRTVSEQALATVSNLDQLVATNGGQVDLVVSNLVRFSRQLNGLADSAGGLLATNGAEIAVAAKNITASTAILKNVMTDLQAGKGLAGTLLQDQLLSSNVQAIAGNLAVTTSNLNREGLWGILWSHKPAKPAGTNAPASDGLPRTNK
jgi:phospholipid/cholesterol/gamma-HCH transport system substrate-binding protein